MADGYSLAEINEISLFIYYLLQNLVFIINISRFFLYFFILVKIHDKRAYV